MSRLFTVQFYYGKGLISDRLYSAVLDSCTWELTRLADANNSSSVTHPNEDDDMNDDTTPGTPCLAAVKAAFAGVGNHNLYNVDDFCDDGGGSSLSGVEVLEHFTAKPEGGGWLSLARPRGAAAAAAEVEVEAGAEAGGPTLGSTQNWCGSDDASYTWQQRADVAAALHVKTGTKGMQYIGGPGTMSGVAADLRPVYKALALKYPLLIFSGQSDGCVPYVGTADWTAGLGFPETKAWHPWYGSTGAGGRSAAAGYSVHYGAPAKSFQFVTIKGAGHEVPAFKPAAALDLLNAFLAGAVP
jgi:hypothetical protein